MAAVGLAGVVAAAGWFASSALPVATGHKAKALCSGVFVSKRSAADVLDDLEADDLAVLRYVDASIDVDARTVTTRALGVERRAIYREGLGCALALDDLTPPRLPVSGAEPGVAGRPSEAGLPWRSLESRHRGSGATLDAVIARAFAEPDPQRPRRTRAIVVLHGGRIAAERYAAGIGPDTPLACGCCSGAVMSPGS